LLISVTVSGATDTVDFQSVEVIQLSAGSDTVGVEAFSPLMIDAAGGDDTIRARNNGFSTVSDTTVLGGDGSDTIFVHPERPPAALLGGPGNDAFTDIPGNGSSELDRVSLDGGSGVDSVVVGGDGNSYEFRYFVPSGIEVVHHRGDAGFQLIGNELDNILVAGSGFEYAGATINGAGGNDSIIGTLFADSIIGGDGNDTLRGGLGRDTVDGGEGTDWLIADDDGVVDALIGGAGFDRVILLGNAADDELFGIERVLPERRAKLVVG
jgi:Ca2+-binding RTX toxin-like protein